MDHDTERRRDDLSPTPVERLARLTRPDWVHTAAARRVAAGVLCVLALILAVRGDPDSDQVAIVTAARDLAPGSAVTEADVRLATVAADTVPDGSLRTVDDAIGHTLAGPARSGEPLTDVRLLGPRLAAATAGADARIVPLRIDDTEIAGLLRAGDRVDILTVDVEESTQPRLLASDAAVVLVTPGEAGRAAREPVVLVALPADVATTVAAAALGSAVTVTLH
ncbi:SAF domain-containing protein [Rhodococcus sp. NPDC003318]|uniref:SAF domain-containing protein n=1 Tax=Rhodococcus sp. NPDC003318 TaxID=3364503 RepID=UPI0036A1632D